MKIDKLELIDAVMKVPRTRQKFLEDLTGDEVQSILQRLKPENINIVMSRMTSSQIWAYVQTWKLKELKALLFERRSAYCELAIGVVARHIKWNLDSEDKLIYPDLPDKILYIDDTVLGENSYQTLMSIALWAAAIEETEGHIPPGQLAVAATEFMLLEYAGHIVSDPALHLPDDFPFSMLDLQRALYERCARPFPGLWKAVVIDLPRPELPGTAKQSHFESLTSSDEHLM